MLVIFYYKIWYTQMTKLFFYIFNQLSFDSIKILTVDVDMIYCTLKTMFTCRWWTDISLDQPYEAVFQNNIFCFFTPIFRGYGHFQFCNFTSNSQHHWGGGIHLGHPTERCSWKQSFGHLAVFSISAGCWDIDFCHEVNRMRTDDRQLEDLKPRCLMKFVH